MTLTGGPSPRRGGAEAEALDLAGGRLGQLADEIDPSGRLVAGEPPAHVLGERGRQRVISRRAVLEHAEGMGADEAVRITAASRTAGCSARQLSTSAGDTHTPPTFSMSSPRPWK